MQKLKMQSTDEIQSYGNAVAELVREPGLLILSASFPIENRKYFVQIFFNVFIAELFVHLYFINNNSKTTEVMFCTVCQL